MKNRPVLLLICDGWGHAPPSEGNAISRARTPIYDRWLAEYPWTLLEASGEAVGLPAGVMGNSEVGHLTLGAGRMVPQDLLRIDLALRDGSFFENPALAEAIRQAKARGATLHLMGLLSDGGVHSHERHLEGLLELAARAGVPRVRVHAFTDGRDTPPRSASGYLERLEKALAKWGGRIASVSGRYYAMDRDKRWDRVARAYQALVFSSGLHAASAAEAVEASYARDESDEFLQPTVIVEKGEPVGPIRDGDAVVFFNFRADRARQLTRALTETAFAEFPRPKPPRTHFVCLTEYKSDFGLPVAFRRARPGAHPRGRLGRCRRREPAPGRDREVRARHVLLQRRSRVSSPGRGTHPRAVLEGRDVRSAPRDERGADHGRGGPSPARRPLRRLRRQLRQRRHGGTHGQSFPRPSRRSRRSTAASASWRPPAATPARSWS